MDEETFEKELTMCRRLSEGNGGRCNWGECAHCGVIPLLHKLRHGVLLESAEAVGNAKKEVFGETR